MNKLSRLTHILASVFVATMLATSQAYGDRLFATTGAGESASTLYELDPVTGAMLNIIGPINFDEVVSIDFHPTSGVLYGISNSSKELITIDTKTGAGTFIAAITGSMAANMYINSPDMSFDSEGILYTWSENLPDNLNVIDIVTGNSFQVGDNGLNNTRHTGLDVDSKGTMYFKGGSGDVYIVNTDDGTINFMDNIAIPDLDVFDNALAFDSLDNLFTFDRIIVQEFDDDDDGELISSTPIEVDLYSIDLLAGETTFIGSTGLPTLAAIAFQKSGSEFETFSITKAEIQFEDDPDKEKFKSEGVFTLDPGGEGIDPLNEEVTFGAGTVLVTIPVGSFVSGAGVYEFKGIIDGADVKVKIEQMSLTEFKFKAEAKGVDLTGTANPAEFVFTIGSKTGNALVRLEGKLKFPGKKDKKDKKDKKGKKGK
jgi:hypothetical protein